MSLLKIANRALSHIGVRQVLSLTANGPAADQCNTHVADAVKEVLRAHPWSFATEWASLAKLVETPPFGYDYAYALPGTVVKVIDVRASTDLRSPPINYTLVRGNKVYTDASPAYARYTVYLESDLSAAPPDFLEACAWKLADILKVPLAKSSNLVDTARRYAYALDAATLGDASSVRERQTDEDVSNTILAAREYPGAFEGGS